VRRSSSIGSRRPLYSLKRPFVAEVRIWDNGEPMAELGDDNDFHEQEFSTNASK
jgi:hypothetical protein